MRWCRSRRDELLEIGIITGAMRAILLGGAIMLSIAVSTIVSNPRVMMTDLLAISLLYFFTADLVYVVRLAAYARLRDTIESGNVQIRDTPSEPIERTEIMSAATAPTAEI
jgi:hypothetical protein